MTYPYNSIDEGDAVVAFGNAVGRRLTPQEEEAVVKALHAAWDGYTGRMERDAVHYRQGGPMVPEIDLPEIEQP